MDIITQRCERHMQLADIALKLKKRKQPLRKRWAKTPIERIFEKVFHRRMTEIEKKAFRLTK